MKELNNIYLISNPEDYKCFMQDEWKQHDLYWYSSCDRKVEHNYDELNKRGGNLYFRIVNNDMNGCKEIIVHTSKERALQDVKNYPNLNVNDDKKKIAQPSRIERIDDLARAYQLQSNKEEFAKTFANNGYTEYEAKAASAVLKYGRDWHKHVDEMQPIKGQTQETLKERLANARKQAQEHNSKLEPKNRNNEHVL